MATMSIVRHFTWWKKRGGSEFSGYEIELQNRVTQNDVTFRVTNSKIFIVTLLSKLKNKKFHFELLTRR